MRLSKEEVGKVAKLANLAVSQEELERYSGELSAILEYIEKINSVAALEVEASFNVAGKQTVMRADQVVAGLSQDEAIANGKTIEKGLFVTKGVFAEE